MLTKNFLVSRQILNDVVKKSFLALRFSKRVSQNDKFIECPQNKNRSTSERYIEKFKQCPKTPFQQFCHKIFSLKPESKCKEMTASDNYLTARQSLEHRIKDTTKFVENESQLILNDIKNRLEINKDMRTAQLEQLFKKTTKKLDELIKLDVSYGFWMRKETLLLNDEIIRSFDALERTVAQNIKNVTSMLKNLQNDVSTCVECAKETLFVCRNHDVPTKLADCVKEQSVKTTKMLDQMNEDARLKLEEISKLRESIVTAHERMVKEVIEVNHKKADELLKYLEKYIVKLKKLNK